MGRQAAETSDDKMQDFFTGMQFLTRICIVKQSEWSAESFGRSVKYFPLIGGVIGVSLGIINCLVGGYLSPFPGVFPPNVVAAVLVTANILITGGLHSDGLMDTMDGIIFRTFKRKNAGNHER